MRNRKPRKKNWHLVNDSNQHGGWMVYYTVKGRRVWSEVYSPSFRGTYTACTSYILERTQ